MTGPSPSLDWAGLMRAGIYGLRLKPREFWALTPAELWLMLGAEAGETPMDRTRLGQLSAAFPDTKRQDIGAENG